MFEQTLWIAAWAGCGAGCSRGIDLLASHQNKKGWWCFRFVTSSKAAKVIEKIKMLIDFKEMQFKINGWVKNRSKKRHSKSNGKGVREKVIRKKKTKGLTDSKTRI